MDVIVGNLGCTVDDVVRGLKSAETFTKLYDKLYLLGPALRVSYDRIEKYEMEYRLVIGSELGAIVRFVLVDWLCNSEEHTLKDLVLALESCQLNECKTTLLKKLNFTMTSDMKFSRVVASSSAKNQSNVQSNLENMDKAFKKPKGFKKNLPALHFDADGVTGSDHKCILNEDYYDLPPKNKGYVLILNNVDNRDGAEFDSINVYNLFSEMGYRVTRHDEFYLSNPVEKRKELDSIIRDFKSNIRKPHSIIVFIGSHGSFGTVRTKDNKYVFFHKHIIHQFNRDNAPDLIEIPKIFFIEACQPFMSLQVDATDDVAQMEIPTSSTEAEVRKLQMNEVQNSPLLEKTLIWQMLPGLYALRDAQIGSIFIYSLCKVIWNKGHNTDVESMEIEVNKEMQDSVVPVEGEIPSILGSKAGFYKKFLFYFPSSD